ncbi:hypothetical protein FPSE5266_20207 [Fusarium pseudograminearum]|nr:hypothetical protein FPSE5266_20207 [Fusarium pseudograminearum]
MCYSDLGTLVCQACGRRVGEQPVGTSPCLAICGKYVSRVTGTVVSASDALRHYPNPLDHTLQVIYLQGTSPCCGIQCKDDIQAL